MIPTDTSGEQALDQLNESIAAVLHLLERGDESPVPLPEPAPGSPLESLVDTFGLSPFETGIVLLAAARELVPGVDVHCARWNGSDTRPHPTFAMALAVLPGADWAATIPTAALRRHELVRLGAGDVLTERAIHLDERILHHLLGASYIDRRVERRLAWVDPPSALPAAHRDLAARVAELHGSTRLHLWTDIAGAGTPIAATAMAARGRRLARLAPASLPHDPAELDELARLADRETRLGTFALIVDLDEAADPASTRVATELADRLGTSCLTTGIDALAGADLERIRVRRAPFADRLSQWEDALADLPPVDRLEQVVARFALDASELDAAVAEVRRAVDRDGTTDVRPLLWRAARSQAQPQLEDLAQRVDTRRTWSDLVLPEPQTAALRVLLSHARQKATVDHAWGFTPDGAAGGGSAAVLAGPSGTGKTLAAEVLAGELDLDLFRIDLSAVVSKYIGETEKNLRRVFDAAESGGAVLLFDEADALFGKRTEIKDSHDRHANIEVSYLLQRMETFSGLALLTTNHRKHLDEAFLRRIPFVIEFPFPTELDRRAIWAKAFPAGTPLDGLDLQRLAQLSLAGGNIRTVARNAASLAADADHAVTMAVIRQAVDLEYDKLGRALTPGEVRGWT